MEDKELKKRLKKIPDVDKNGDPIYKIDISGAADSSSRDKRQSNLSDKNKKSGGR